MLKNQFPPKWQNCILFPFYPTHIFLGFHIHYMVNEMISLKNTTGPTKKDYVDGKVKYLWLLEGEGENREKKLNWLQWVNGILSNSTGFSGSLLKSGKQIGCNLCKINIPGCFGGVPGRIGDIPGGRIKIGIVF